MCVTEEFKVRVGVLQGSALGLSLFTMLLDRLTGKVRQKSLQTVEYLFEWEDSKWNREVRQQKGEDFKHPDR